MPMHYEVLVKYKACDSEGCVDASSELPCAFPTEEQAAEAVKHIYQHAAMGDYLYSLGSSYLSKAKLAGTKRDVFPWIQETGYNSSKLLIRVGDNLVSVYAFWTGGMDRFTSAEVIAIEDDISDQTSFAYFASVLNS